MGMFAGEILPLELPQNGKRLLTFVETDGCFSDGVSVATGCSIGHRTMRVVDYGKVAATFVDSVTGRAWRICPSPIARTRAAAVVPEAASRWQGQLEAYQRIPDEELLIRQEVTLTVDLAAIVGKPGTRATCSVCREEVLNQREVMKDGQLMCKSCAGERYWRPKG
jgi:formylmethanofuran dehydrogenase subunit E